MTLQWNPSWRSVTPVQPIPTTKVLSSPPSESHFTHESWIKIRYLALKSRGETQEPSLQHSRDLRSMVLPNILCQLVRSSAHDGTLTW